MNVGGNNQTIRPYLRLPERSHGITAHKASRHVQGADHHVQQLNSQAGKHAVPVSNGASVPGHSYGTIRKLFPFNNNCAAHPGGRAEFLSQEAYIISRDRGYPGNLLRVVFAYMVLDSLKGGLARHPIHEEASLQGRLFYTGVIVSPGLFRRQVPDQWLATFFLSNIKLVRAYQIRAVGVSFKERAV